MGGCVCVSDAEGDTGGGREIPEWEREEQCFIVKVGSGRNPSA